MYSKIVLLYISKRYYSFGERMDFSLETLVYFAIAAAVVFGIMVYKNYLTKKGIDVKDATASKLIKLVQTLVDKYEVEIKAYDTANGTTYWEDVNAILTKMSELMLDEDIGIMGYLQAILEFKPEIEKILEDIGLKDKV